MGYSKKTNKLYAAAAALAVTASVVARLLLMQHRRSRLNTSLQS